MNGARRTIYFALSILIFSCFSCAGSTGNTGTKLLDISQLTTPENAQRALIIAQDTRINAMTALVKAKNAGVKTEADIENFRQKDTLFRTTWDLLDRLVASWKLSGEKPELSQLYSTLIELIKGYQEIAGVKNGDV
jgi:hypothetical protein